MKSKITAIILGILLIFLIPATILVAGIATPSQYGNTYYGELAVMYDKLYKTENRKIVVLGNSAVAFGVDSALLQRELNDCDIDYDVCNFGLYGALGTKMMMDLSLDAIQEGDIVIFMPELITQSMSLYFSSEQAWRALDCNKEMMNRLDVENRKQLFGGYVNYVAEKFSYFLNGGANGSGVYASDSFDENCDMKNFSREENTMQGGYDPNSLIDFSVSLLEENFVDYVNAYHSLITQKGAKMYFYFAPINERCVTEEGKNNIDSFCGALSDQFNFTILGNPNDCIMQAEWFYDANVHLNSYGMTVYTATLADAIKTRFGCGKPSGIKLPAMPELPKYNVQEGAGDNTHAGYFVYEDDGSGGLIAIDLTEQGKEQTELIIPWSVDGKVITAFSSELFQNNEVIKQITVQSNIRRLSDRSFNGCVALEKLILKHRAPSDLAISTDLLLEDSPLCLIYVDQDVLTQFIGDYFWSYYAQKLRGQV